MSYYSFTDFTSKVAKNAVQERRKGRLKGLGYICLLTLMVLLFYWEGLGGYFNGVDMLDLRFAVDNAQTWYISHPECFRPISYSLFYLTHVSFGLNPLPYRILSLTLYISILLLLYYFYSQLQDNRTLSKVAVLLFASFYLHVDVVTTISSQRELPWVLFGMATLICFIHYRKTRCLRYYALALFFALLSILSKEVAACLPLLLLAVDYHVSYGTFPPRLPPLKDLRQGLKPHVPFWLMALAVFAFYLSVPERSLLPYYVSTSTFLVLPERFYWLGIYSLSPCFITDRLTIILAFSIVAGLGWLFYRSTAQRRSLIVTMAACTGLSLFPYVLVGPIARYFLLPSVFSMLLVTLLAFEIGGSVYRFLEERLGHRSYPGHWIASLALLILLPAIYLNYQEVRQYNENSVYAGRLLKEIVEGTARILPKGPGESTIIYLNLPNTVQSKAVMDLTNYVAITNDHIAALDLYYRQYGIKLVREETKDRMTIFIDLGYTSPPNYYRNIGSAYIDLGYDTVKLSSKAWYDLAKAPAFISTLSGEEFDALSMEGGNKILFFNPGTNKLIDVSGWSYEQLEGSIAPYRDKLN